MFRNRLYYKEVNYIVKRILSVPLSLGSLACLGLSLGSLLFRRQQAELFSDLLVLFIGLCCGATAWYFHRSASLTTWK